MQIKNVNDVAYCMEKKTFSLSSTILPANLIIFILSRTICHILAYTLLLYTDYIFSIVILSTY